MVHAHFGVDATIVAPSISRLGLPLVVTFHGYDASLAVHSRSAEARRYVRRLPELFEVSAAIIAVSDYLRDRLLELGAPQEKVRTLRIGVGVAPNPPIRSDDGSILFVGRLVEKKGVGDLFDAVAGLSPPFREVPVKVIGTGPLEAELRDQAQRLNLNVTFLGYRTPEQVRAEMLRAAFLCAPSKTASSGDTEGLPIVIQEASALAVPVVGTWHAGIPEAVVDELTGLLVPEGDVAKLGMAIERLLSSDSLREKMGLAGHQHILAHFNLVDQCAELERLYDDVCRQIG